MNFTEASTTRKIWKCALSPHFVKQWSRSAAQNPAENSAAQVAVDVVVVLVVDVVVVEVVVDGCSVNTIVAV